MILKTYGIENLVDWKAQINVGKAKVIVHFTGGAITRYGVTPAEYSTADAMMQHVIEGSDYYKSGRIKLLRTTEVADDAATHARKARAAKRAMRKAEDSLDGEAAEHSRLPQDGKGGEYGEAAEHSRLPQEGKGGEYGEAAEHSRLPQDGKGGEYGEAAEHSRLPQEGKGGEYGEAAETQGEPRAPERTNLTATKDGAEQGETQAEVTGETGAGLTEVEVSCLQDAQDYLKENFNEATTSIRSYEKAQAAAAEHGVKFVGSKF